MLLIDIFCPHLKEHPNSITWSSKVVQKPGMYWVVLCHSHMPWSRVRSHLQRDSLWDVAQCRCYPGMPVCLNVKTGLGTDDRNGEKLLLVSHPKLDMNTILAFTSLWWFTDTYPYSIYPYRQVSVFSLYLSLPLSLLLPYSSRSRLLMCS